MLSSGDGNTRNRRGSSMKTKSPRGLIDGVARPKSPDALVLLSCGVAAIALFPLRNVFDAFPPITFAATLVLFMAPGFLLSEWFLGDDLSGFAYIPVGFAISTGVFGLLGVPALILHLGIDAYLLAAGLALCAFLVAAAWRTWRARSR